MRYLFAMITRALEENNFTIFCVKRQRGASVKHLRGNFLSFYMWVDIFKSAIQHLSPKKKFTTKLFCYFHTQFFVKKDCLTFPRYLLSFLRSVFNGRRVKVWKVWLSVGGGQMLLLLSTILHGFKRSLKLIAG